MDEIKTLKEAKEVLLSVEKCKMCWEVFVDQPTYDVRDCKCTFCLKCVKEYLTMSIQEGNVTSLECPDQDCPNHGVFNQDEIANLVNAELFKKYKKFKFHKEVDFNPNQSFCPRKHCGALCSVGEEDTVKLPKYCSKIVTCYKCEYKFCMLCKENWHPGINCVENIKLLQKSQNFDGIRYDESEEAIIKRCPFCFLPIEREGGCAQIKCKKCNHIFCWFCLACLDRDALFFHYERGPCKNKLGHSRASIIWHRIQVITIIAGLGLLIMLASPLLFIAAPCFVCCKIRNIKNTKNHQNKKHDRSNISIINSYDNSKSNSSGNKNLHPIFIEDNDESINKNIKNDNNHKSYINYKKSNYNNYEKINKINDNKLLNNTVENLREKNYFLSTSYNVEIALDSLKTTLSHSLSNINHLIERGEIGNNTKGSLQDLKYTTNENNNTEIINDDDDETNYKNNHFHNKIDANNFTIVDIENIVHNNDFPVNNFVTNCLNTSSSMNSDKNCKNNYNSIAINSKWSNNSFVTSSSLKGNES